MKVVVTKRCVTLGTFPLPCVVSRFQTLEAEHVKTFGQDGVLHASVAAWTGQLRLQGTSGMLTVTCSD